MADVATKQQKSALFLSIIVTCTRRYTELKKKLTTQIGNLCCAREHPVQFFIQFFYTVNPLPLLFKALLQGQKDRVFFQRAFNLRTTIRAL
jgi:hypothetical protein